MRLCRWLVLTLVAVFYGMISPARATQYVYEFVMDGPSERPAVASLGTGTGSAIYDDAAGTLTLAAAFAGLNGNVTQTHFHAVTATSGLPDMPGETFAQAANAVVNASIAVGNTSLPGFPLGATSGIYNQVLDLNSASIYNAAFLANNGGAAGARATFVQALADAKTYWNIHTTTSGGGEIRGFPLLVRVIPEPSSIGLAALGLLGIARIARIRNKVAAC